ncbi:MAG: RNA methyltransferase [Butyrivibrio sp.]|nr:RNA methyltransferase [Butyrivibrio sp.]
MGTIINTTVLSKELLDIYDSRSENRLKRLYEPDPGLFIAESTKVVERALDAGYEPVSALVSKEALVRADAARALERLAEVPIYVAEEEILTQITGYKLTGGMLCAMRRRSLPSLKDVCEGAKRIALLEDVENPTNIGAIFRSAAALYVDAVVLAGGSCDPLYRRAIRVSMGTVFQIPWTIISPSDSDYCNDPVTTFQKMGYKTAAMALSDDSISLWDPILNEQEKLVIIMGSEGYGLKESTIKNSDYVVKIPMSEGVDSLNVAAASAVAFWQLACKH